MFIHLKIHILAILLLALFCCQKQKQKEFPFEKTWGVFASNGKLFAFSHSDLDKPKFIDIMDENGDIKFQFKDDYYNYYYGAFGKNSFHFVKYDRALKLSSWQRCELDFKTCKTVLEQKGSIGGFVELDNNDILYQFSPYNEPSYKHAGYMLYGFNLLKADTGEHIKLKDYGISFAWQGSPVLIDGKLYVSLYSSRSTYSDSFVNVSLFNMDSAYILEIDYANKSYKLKRKNDKLKNDGVIISKYYKDNKIIYFLGMSGRGGRVYHVCIVENTPIHECPKPNVQTTPPAVVGDFVYYGVWNYDLDKIEIRKINIKD